MEKQKFSSSVLIAEENLQDHGLSFRVEDPNDLIIDEYDDSDNTEMDPELRETFAKKRALEKDVDAKKKAAREAAVERKARAAKEPEERREAEAQYVEVRADREKAIAEDAAREKIQDKDLRTMSLFSNKTETHCRSPNGLQYYC